MRPFIISRMENLLNQAIQLRARAYCPFSHYAVGAALETVSGEIFAGCNAETATYSETDHAERAAISQAIASGSVQNHGPKFISRLVVVHEQGTPPCGGCLQRIAEHASDNLVITTAKPDGAITGEYALIELLPHAFTL